MSAKYLFTELPQWELDVLLGERDREQERLEKDAG